MPIDLAPHDLVLQDWGRPAVLRKSPTGLASPPVIDHAVTVIPQTVRLTPTDTIAVISGESRTFLIQAIDLPEPLRWIDCELVIDNATHRVIAAEDSETGGWVLLETHALPPRSAV